MSASAAAAPAAPAPPAVRLRGHVPVLDGVRGVAILLVMVYHFWTLGARAVGVVDRAAWAVVGAGWVGVDLFFVLSGFLITGILLEGRGRPHALRNFYARRVLRIFPVYYAALLALTALGVAAALARHHPFVGPALWCWLYLTNVVLAAGYSLAGPYYVTHFWSLAVEEQFYLVWPWVVRWLGPKGLARASLWIIAGALALRAALVLGGTSTWAAYVLTPTRIDSLAAGALLACWLREGSPWAARLAPRALAGFGAGVAGFALLAVLQRSSGTEGPWLPTLGLSFAALASAGLLLHVLVAAPAGALARALEGRWLTDLGKYSYGLYVIHLPVQHLLTVGWPGPQVVVAGSAIPWALARVAVGIAISYALARLSWRFVEEPFLRLKGRFA